MLVLFALLLLGNESSFTFIYFVFALLWNALLYIRFFFLFSNSISLIFILLNCRIIYIFGTFVYYFYGKYFLQIQHLVFNFVMIHGCSLSKYTVCILHIFIHVLKVFLNCHCKNCKSDDKEIDEGRFIHSF